MYRHKNLITSRGSSLANAYQFVQQSTCIMSVSYLAEKWAHSDHNTGTASMWKHTDNKQLTNK